MRFTRHGGSLGSAPGLAIRTRTGSGLRQPGFTAPARRALTSTYGFTPRMRIRPLKRVTSSAKRPAEEIGLEHAFGIEPLLEGQVGVDALAPEGPDHLIGTQH